MRIPILNLFILFLAFINCSGDKYSEFRSEIALENHDFLIAIDNSGSIDTNEFKIKYEKDVISRILSDSGLGPGSKIFVLSFAETCEELTSNNCIAFDKFDTTSNVVLEKLKKNTTNSANFLLDSAKLWKKNKLKIVENDVRKKVSESFFNRNTNSKYTNILPFMGELKDFIEDGIIDSNKELIVYFLSDYNFDDEKEKWPDNIRFSQRIKIIPVNLKGVKSSKKDAFVKRLKEYGATVVP